MTTSSHKTPDVSEPNVSEKNEEGYNGENRDSSDKAPAESEQTKTDNDKIVCEDTVAGRTANESHTTENVVDDSHPEGEKPVPSDGPADSETKTCGSSPGKGGDGNGEKSAEEKGNSEMKPEARVATE